MSFKSREKKRIRKAAIGNVRSKHGETMKSRHYLTKVQRDCCCNTCGRALRKKNNDDLVYRHEPREVLCLSCAAEGGVNYRTSQRWDKANRTRRERSQTR